MAWTAQLTKASVLDGDAVLVVTFKDDAAGASFDEAYRFRAVQSNSFLRDKVRDRIKELNAVSAWVPTLPIGAIVPSTDPAPPPATTQAELDRNAWLGKYRQLQSWMRAVNVGLESATDPLFTDLKADVLATRLPSYRQLY